MCVCVCVCDVPQFVDDGSGVIISAHFSKQLHLLHLQVWSVIVAAIEVLVILGPKVGLSGHEQLDVLQAGVGQLRRTGTKECEEWSCEGV